MKKRIITLFVTCGLFVASCSNDKDDEMFVEPKTVVEPKTLSFDTDLNSSLMFQDSESEEVMTANDRRYNIAHLIRVKAVDQKSIEIANFSPIDIQDATIVATISSGVGSPSQVVKLFKISKIRAHAKQIIKYPFVEGTTLFLDMDNNTVDLSQYSTTGIDPSKIAFDFTGDNPTIVTLKKLDKLKWDIQYHDFNPTNDPNSNWSDDITPKQVRRFTGLMINLGLIIVSDTFKQEFLKEQIIGNDGTTVLTLAEKEKTYNDLLIHPFFQCGAVGRAGNNTIGLGGGSTFGLADYVIKDYINKIGYGDTPAHELGHCVDFNHSSNMTYPKTIDNISTGFSPVMIRMFNKFFAEKSFVITLNNYYKPADFN